MSQPRIRLEPCTPLGEGLYRLDEAQAHHLTRVLRCYEGALVEGLEARGRVLLRLRVREGRVEAEEVQRVPQPVDLLRVVLLVGLLKADQMDPLLRSAAELGVAEIRLLACDRSVPRLEGSREEAKKGRWERILHEATRQAGSLEPPRLLAPVPVDRTPEEGLPSRRFGAFLAPDTEPLGRFLPLGEAAVAVIEATGNGSEPPLCRLAWVGANPGAKGARRSGLSWERAVPAMTPGGGPAGPICILYA